MKRITILAAVAILFASGTASLAGALAPEIANPGFEQDAANWAWMTNGGCNTGFSVETTNPHSGAKCLKLVNNSGFAPNVYGRLLQNVPVHPDTEYEFSVWVRGEDVEGEKGASHFTDWSCYTINLPIGTFDWTRVSGKIKTRLDQHFVGLGLNIINSAKALVIDDISLRAVGKAFTGTGVEGSLIAPNLVVGRDAAGYMAVVLKSSLGAGASVEATIKSDKSTILRKRSEVKPGDSEIEWDFGTGKAPFGEYMCTVRVVDAQGKTAAEASQKMVTENSPITVDIEAVEKRVKEFERLYKQCEARGIALDYPTIARTLLAEYIPLAKADVKLHHEWRAAFAVKDFNRTIDEATAEMKAYLADATLAPNVPRYQTGKVSVEGLSFVGTSKDSKGVVAQGPLFFCGYGHFARTREDMPLWPGYGTNIIQSSEFGPSAVFPEEGKVSLDSVKTLQKALDEAAKNNVRVDFLLSPHYFPQWVLNKYPHLMKGNGGFLGFAVDEPEAKKVVEDFLRLVIPMVKDKPALHSFCLSNEPAFPNFANCDNTKPMWLDYLKGKHGTIGTLNKRYGTSYASFADVPIEPKDAVLYDYCVFIQERFAAWHKWMGDICHELAPSIPVHAKIMSTELNPSTIGWGTDHELFGQNLDLNGNDCYMVGSGPAGQAIDFAFQGSSYDMQRSFARKPIFNSENHLTADFSRGYTAPEHFRTALWQGAVHGQGSTTIWVWERTNDPGECLYGNVGDRPGCAQAVGATCLDLNRFAYEVTALQNAQAPVAILYSMTSMIRNGGAHADSIWRAYVALNFCGVKVDFISEKQLAAGKGSQYKLIVLPQASHVTDAAFEAIQKLPAATRVAFLNECLTGDPYGKTRSADLVAEVKGRNLALTNGDASTVLWPALLAELDKLGALPEYSVVDASTGQSVWGVEWLPVTMGDRTVVNMVNMMNTPKDVKIVRRGRKVSAKNMLSLGGREIVKQLKPITPVLAEVIR